jgi:hypothetical protein
MTMTQGVAERFRLVVMSFLNLRHTSNMSGQHAGLASKRSLPSIKIVIGGGR